MNLRKLLRPRVLTIAFHDEEVRWSLGSRGAISSVGSARLPEGLVRDAIVTDPEAAGRILRESAIAGSSRLLQVTLAIPAQRSVFRQIDVPAIKRGRDELIEREVRREMPMLAENAYVSWALAGERDGKSSVFVVGAARDVLDSHVAPVRAANFTPDVVDLRVIAAARAIGADDAIVAYVENTEIEIAILRSGIPGVIRHVAMAASSEAAWSDQLGAELARTLKFYRDSHRDEDWIDKLPISFVGGAARRAMLIEGLANATGQQFAMPELRTTVRPEDQTVRFAANIGLALKDAAA